MLFITCISSYYLFSLLLIFGAENCTFFFELLQVAVLMPFISVLYSFQGSPSEDRNFRSDVDDTETEEASFSGQDDSDLIDILEWAKVQNELFLFGSRYDSKLFVIRILCPGVLLTNFSQIFRQTIMDHYR